MSKMKNCKSCNAEVAKSAKTCPKCGAKIKGGLVKKVFIAWVVIAVIVAIMRSGGSTGPVSVSGGHVLEKGTTTLVPTTETITVGDVAVSISNVQSSTGFQGSMGILSAKAQPGAILVAVLADYKNVGKKPLNPMDLDEIKLLNPSGTVFEYDLGKSASYAGIINIDQKIVSDISPGLRSQDVFVFEVSADEFKKSGWKLQIGSIKDVMYKIN